MGDGLGKNTGTLSDHTPAASEPTSHLSEEFNLLFMWRLLHSSTADHGLCGEGKEGIIVGSSEGSQNVLVGRIQQAESGNDGR